MKKNDPEEMIKFGLHLGHKAKKINPKTREFIYKIEKGICIIDLYKTAIQLDKARSIVEKLGQEGKKILFVATKKHAREVVQELCREKNINYLTFKWTGGFLTNFDEIVKNVKKLIDYRSQKEDGSWAKLPKHEIVDLEKKLSRIGRAYSGVEDLDRLPDGLFIVDIKREETALREALDRNILTIAIVDTNSDPTLVDYPIVANDDSRESIEYITKQIIEAYEEGRKKASTSNKKE